MLKNWKAAAVVGVLGVAGVARAHEFSCTKRIIVDGNTQDGTPRVTHFPATLRFEYTLKNIHPTLTSLATGVEDPLLTPYGEEALFITPMPVGVGESREASFELVLETPEACQALAASDGVADDNFDSALRVKWPMGETQCAARVTCCEPFVDCDMACPPDDPYCVESTRPQVAAPSRNAGFFKVHEQALAQCLAPGAIELGVARIDSLEGALGLLWASPGLDRRGEVRTEADARRFELAREALVSTCNDRLLGATAARSATLEVAVKTLTGTSTGADLEQLAHQLQHHNDAGLGQPLPSGFDAGAATPAHASSIAADPITPSQP